MYVMHTVSQSPNIHWRWLLQRDGGKLVLSQSNPLTLKRKTSKFAQLVLIKSIEGLLMELAAVEEAAAMAAAAAAVASSLVHHEELKPNYTTSSLLHTGHHHLSNTSYLPDLLPVHAHDVMLQQHHHDTCNLFPINTHTAIGHHMLEGLQPIRKEEM
jgi:hypothetical protein